MTIRRFILTGTPGSGKTAIINHLSALGYATIPEAATELIQTAQSNPLNPIERPWEDVHFIQKILDRQMQDLQNSSRLIQFYDRSPFCTYALLVYLFKNKLINSTNIINITDILENCVTQDIFQKTVFFCDQLDFIEQTSVRQISYEDAKCFEDIHREVYTQFGFTLHRLKPKPIDDRVAEILTYCN